MNTTFLYLILLHLTLSFNGFYNLSIRKADGSLLQMAALTGKKVMVVTVNPTNLDNVFLSRLDSMEKVFPNLVTIIVPAVDFADSTFISSGVQTINAPSSLIMTEVMKVKKINGVSQNAIFQWLTNVGQNKHFDRDVEEEQIFFINEKGILYGILGMDTTLTELKTTLQQQIKNVE